MYNYIIKTNCSNFTIIMITVNIIGVHVFINQYSNIVYLQELLEKALGGLLKKQDENCTNARELDKLIQQQRTIERELSRVLQQLAEASKVISFEPFPEKTCFLHGEKPKVQISCVTTLADLHFFSSQPK